jgi:hypothetical protein
MSRKTPSDYKPLTQELVDSFISMYCEGNMTLPEVALQLGIPNRQARSIYTNLKANNIPLKREFNSLFKKLSQKHLTK